MRASNLNRYYFLELSSGNKYPSTFGALTYHARPGSVLFENETHVASSPIETWFSLGAGALTRLCQNGCASIAVPWASSWMTRPLAT